MMSQATADHVDMEQTPFNLPLGTERRCRRPERRCQWPPMGTDHGSPTITPTNAKAGVLPISPALFEGCGADISSLTTEGADRITEEMLQEMDYDADRAWYDREEHSTVFDTYGSSLFPGDGTSYQKKEAELAKKLTRMDGRLMTHSQSKKLSQLTTDNAQWEDRQLMRSGAVRGSDGV